MDIIDFHVHGGSPERSNEIARYIEQSGISAMGMLSLPRPPDDSKATYNDEIREGLRRIHGLRPAFPIISFGSLDDEALIGSAIASGDGSRADASRNPADPGEFAEALKAQGFNGVKLWEGKPELVRRLSLNPDDERIIAVCRRAGELSMPVIFHVADPPSFWKAGGPYDGDSGLPRFRPLIEAAGRLASRVPGTTLIFPHLLFLASDLPKAAGFLDANPACFFDLAPGNYMFSELSRRPADAAAFFKAYRRRLLFGKDGFWFPADDRLLAGDSYEGNLLRFTRLRDFLLTDREFDNPFPLSSASHPRIRGLKLTEDTLRPILAENAKRIMEAL
jgi:hypothetical protein